MPADLKRTKRVTLGTMCLALFMVMLDGTVVNLGLPTIRRQLNASMSELQWIVDAFVLALASLLLIGLGNGPIMSPMTTAVLGTVPPPRTDMASATSSITRQVGGEFGIVVIETAVGEVGA